MNWQGYWKAILAFVSTIVFPGVVQWAQTGQPWPHNASGWALWAVTVFGTTGAVMGGPANKSAGKHEASA